MKQPLLEKAALDRIDLIIPQDNMDCTLYIASLTAKNQSYLCAVLNNNQFQDTFKHLPHASLKTQLRDVLKHAISLSGFLEGRLLYTSHPSVSLDRLNGYEGIHMHPIASDQNLAFDLLQPFIEYEQG